MLSWRHARSSRWSISPARTNDAPVAQLGQSGGFLNRRDVPAKSNTPNSLQSGDANGAAHGTALGAENAAVAVLSGSLAPDLARVILAWPSLPDESKAAVLALVAAHEATDAGRVRQ